MPIVEPGKKPILDLSLSIIFESSWVWSKSAQIALTLSFGKSVSRLANNQTTASTGMTFFLAGSSGETFSAGFKVVLYGLKT